MYAYPLNVVFVYANIIMFQLSEAFNATIALERQEHSRTLQACQLANDRLTAELAKLKVNVEETVKENVKENVPVLGLSLPDRRSSHRCCIPNTCAPSCFQGCRIEKEPHNWNLPH